MFGGGLTTDEDIKCFHRNSEVSENNFCSTNNIEIGISDTDNDYLPDICDAEPNAFNQKPVCYEGPIQLNLRDGENPISKVDISSSGEGVVGVVFKQNIEHGLTKKSGQCVFALCTPQNNAIYTKRTNKYNQYCPQKVCVSGKRTDDGATEGADSGKAQADSIFANYLTGLNDRTENRDSCYCFGSGKEKNSFAICSNGEKCQVAATYDDDKEIEKANGSKVKINLVDGEPYCVKA